MRAVRLRATVDFPYFARGLCLLQFVEVIGHKTWSIDRHCRVYYDPELLKIWDVKEAAVVMVHDLGHWLRKHFERAEALPETERCNHEHINACEDAELNDDLPGLPSKPFSPVYPRTLGCPEHLTWEEYYARTRKRGLKPQSPLRCGSGAHGGACPWELGAPREEEGLPNPLIAEVVRRAVAHDILRSKAAGGHVAAAGWLSWAEELLGPPRIPWEQQLTGILHQALARKAGQIDYSYQRRSRRQSSAVVLPGMVRPSIRATVVLDTSGSMEEAERTEAVRETLGITRAVAEVTLLCTDSDVRLARRVSSVRDIQLLGGGGTNMGVGMCKALERSSDVTIVITDGHTPWPARHPRPVVVVLVGEDAAPVDSVPSYAKAVQCLSEKNKKNAAGAR